MRRVEILSVFGLTVCATVAVGGGAVFQTIPGAVSANDMSPDGRFIVGDGTSGPYHWDTVTGVTTLLGSPGQSATAVSDDGSVVLGDMDDPEGIGSNVAGIWTSAGGWQSLGALPGALACPSRSDGYELSADGSVAVGLSWEGCSGRGFYWTEETGMLPLQTLGSGGNRASVVSGDGTLIGGFAQGSFSRTPVIWNDTLAGQLLDPPSGDALGEVEGVSDDGSILLGHWNGDAVMWMTDGLVREVIAGGSLMEGWVGHPLDMADDGTIVGFDSQSLSRVAWIQPGGSGPLLNLRTYAQSLGATVPITLEVCQAISADGRYLIGHTTFQGAWRIELPSSSVPGDTDGNGDVDLVDFAAFQLCFNGPGVAVPASCDVVDFDNDGDVDLTDFGSFQLAFTGPM